MIAVKVAAVCFPMSTRQVAAFRNLFDGDGMVPFRRAMDGSLRDCPVRGVAWRVFLNALAGHRDGWLEQLQAQQIKFDVLCAEHCVDPSAVADAMHGSEADVGA